MGGGVLALSPSVVDVLGSCDVRGGAAGSGPAERGCFSS